MGWNYGGAVIDFDYRAALGELAERAQLRVGPLDDAERHAKDLMDCGVLALEDLGLTATPADAPVSFDDASSRDFDDLACGLVGGKTVLLGRRLGLDQLTLAPAAEALSARRGPLLLFWLNDASGTYQFSLFRAGRRVRLWSAGEGLHDDEGAPLPAEAAHAHGFDRTMAVVRALLGEVDLFAVAFERLS